MAFEHQRHARDYTQLQFYNYQFTGFARSTTEQMPALVLSPINGLNFIDNPLKNNQITKMN
jgi:hypothetical protein